MTPLAEPQLRLTLARPSREIDADLVISQPTLLAAVRLCVSLGGFQYDKELYADLDIDAGHWSRILKGEAHFPLDKLGALMDLCGNEAPLIWLNYKRGYDPASMRKRETETQRQLREAQEELGRERLKNQALREALRAA